MCGAAQSLSWDYLPAVPQGEDAERRVSWKEKPIGGLVARVLRLSPPPAQPAPPEITRKDEEANAQIDDDRSDKSSITTVEQPAPALNIPRIVIVGEDMSAADITDVQLTPRASNATAATTYRSRNLTLVIPPSPLPRLSYVIWSQHRGTRTRVFQALLPGADLCFTVRQKTRSKQCPFPTPQHFTQLNDKKYR